MEPKKQACHQKADKFAPFKSALGFPHIQESSNECSSPCIQLKKCPQNNWVSSQEPLLTPEKTLRGSLDTNQGPIQGQMTTLQSEIQRTNNRLGLKEEHIYDRKTQNEKLQELLSSIQHKAAIRESFQLEKSVKIACCNTGCTLL